MLLTANAVQDKFFYLTMPAYSNIIWVNKLYLYANTTTKIRTSIQSRSKSDPTYSKKHMHAPLLPKTNK